jgi:hypothetical protein
VCHLPDARSSATTGRCPGYRLGFVRTSKRLGREAKLHDEGTPPYATGLITPPLPHRSARRPSASGRFVFARDETAVVRLDWEPAGPD